MGGAGLPTAEVPSGSTPTLPETAGGAAAAAAPIGPVGVHARLTLSRQDKRGA
jgi:hypothetical protein